MAESRGKTLLTNSTPVGADQNERNVQMDLKDIERLRAALVLKRTINLHQGDQGFQLKHFRVGRQLTFPVVSPERTYLIDWEVARYFYHTEHYYAAFQDKLNEGMKRLREQLSRYRMGPGFLAPPTGFEVPSPSEL